MRHRYLAIAVVLTSGYSAVLAQEGLHGFELISKPYMSATLVRVFGQAIAQHKALRGSVA